MEYKLTAWLRARSLLGRYSRRRETTEGPRHSNAKKHICAECKTAAAARRYCSPECARIATLRKNKDRQRAKKAELKRERLRRENSTRCPKPRMNRKP